MQELLRRSNQLLIREIDKLETALGAPPPLPEIGDYQARICQSFERLEQEIRQNLEDLALDASEIWPDILSETQRLAGWFRLYNERLVGPLLRALPTDELCLQVIAWVHDKHPDMHDVPAALSDGSFGIWPEPRLPIVYFMPSSRQLGLLYLPLLFHEFGHLLYVCHKPEMDDLVRALQERIEDLLMVLAERNPAGPWRYAGRRRAIVETWYEWTQELFCDAVGLTIGGPAFIHAFSTYFQMGGQREFHLSAEDLEQSSHPVTWLRIRLMIDRAQNQALFPQAQALKDQWAAIAELSDVTEEYYGFYTKRFLPHVRDTIDDMLTETAPHEYEIDDPPTEGLPNNPSPVTWTNLAWERFLAQPEAYDVWEEEAIVQFLAATR